MISADVARIKSIVAQAEYEPTPEIVRALEHAIGQSCDVGRMNARVNFDNNFLRDERFMLWLKKHGYKVDTLGGGVYVSWG